MAMTNAPETGMKGPETANLFLDKQIISLLVVCGQGEDRPLVAIERFHQRRSDHVEGIVGLLATRG
jgi:hypothetical protein